MVLTDVWREHEQQRPHPQRRTHYTTVQTKRTLYFVVFVLVPVYPTTFVFCIFFLRVGKEWREFFEVYVFLLSALVKGEHFWSLSVLVRGRNFNTGSGSRS